VIRDFRQGNKKDLDYWIAQNFGLRDFSGNAGKFLDYKKNDRVSVKTNAVCAGHVAGARKAG